MLALALVFGLAFIGCDNDTTKGEYTLAWGVWSGASYGDISAQFSDKDVTLKPTTDTNAGYLTGADASRAYASISNGSQPFNDSGTLEGSFEDLLNHKENGLGLPDNLKTVLTGKKADAPVAGVFAADGVGVIVFYVYKN
jgi:hypothetical protein